MRSSLLHSFTTACVLVAAAACRSVEPLPSWNDGATKKSITEFVGKVTDPSSHDYVDPKQRVAVFDNDGTLWCEQPMYVQFVFALDRFKELAPKHPEWKEKEPLKALMDGDMKAFEATGEKGIVELLAVTHTGMTIDEFEKIVDQWIATTKNPKTGRLYTEMVYQPMLELMTYLRDNDFQTFIVSGGGVEFMRPWAQRVYGIPPSQVVGSRGKLKFEMKDEKPVLMKLPEIDLVDDGPGKPVGIMQVIGQRPIAAFGNSDGDVAMLEYTTGGSGARFGLIVHHTDAVREYAYDRDSHVGKLDKGLDEAKVQGWTVVDMKNDWKVIYPSK